MCASRSPNEVEVRKMLAVAVASDVRRMLQCHVFGLMEKVYKQKAGGSISSPNL